MKRASILVLTLALSACTASTPTDLLLDLASVSIDGRQYALSTADLEEKGRAGPGKNKRTAEFVGGTTTQAATKGDIRVEAETILTFKLDMPLKVIERRR